MKKFLMGLMGIIRIKKEFQKFPKIPIFYDLIPYFFNKTVKIQ